MQGQSMLSLCVQEWWELLGNELTALLQSRQWAQAQVSGPLPPCLCFLPINAHQSLVNALWWFWGHATGFTLFSPLASAYQQCLSLPFSICRQPMCFCL